jgi:ABC-2 type transport system permease protein
MRVYLSFLLNAFQTAIAYRVNIFFEFLNKIIALFIEVAIWRALYHGITEVSTSVGAVSLRDMVTYAIISTGLSIFIANTNINKINLKINNGQIAIDLIRPINFQIYLFSEMLGQILYDIVIKLIPLIMISILLFGIYFSGPLPLLLFVISVINAVLLNFIITYIIGLLAFWYTQAWQLDYLFQYVMIFLSGAWIPLWFFPGILRDIIDFLPFNLIYYVPLTIYLHKISYGVSWLLIIKQLVWLFIFVMVEKVVWKKAVKKIVVQGG